MSPLLASIFENVSPNCDTVTDPSKCGVNAIFPLLGNLINVALFVAGTLSVIMVIVGAIRYSASAGNPQATAGAKKTITYAIGGLVLAVMGLTIVNFSQGLFK